MHALGAKRGYTWNDVSCDNCYNFTCFTGNIFEEMIRVIRFLSFFLVGGWGNTSLSFQ